MTALISPAFSQMGPLGQFVGQTDVGAPTPPGSATYDRATQEYTLSGAGSNVWYRADQFHFAWTKWKGDFIVRARLEFVGKGAAAHRKAGWMARANLDADSPYVDCAEHGDGLTSLQFRRAKGTNTDQITLAITNADVVQLERRGSTYIFSAARYGELFTSAQVTNLDLGDELYLGLWVCSHKADTVEQAVFRDVRLVRPMKPGFVPYRDYIGSHLEILDVQSGRLELVHSSKQPFEAPNWTRDGAALIFNTSGSGVERGVLCRFDLASRKISVIDTRPQIRNNNDHVLSFDGEMLGISDNGVTNGGQSCIYTLPLAGGKPKQITRKTPSYLHGWSPDKKFLVFTGVRAGKTDIYRIPVDGGEEERLTDASGVNDGPEYTPDGQFIYFNSSRTGKMQIWRMKPDGSAQEQVTHDEYNNWFPHISPDGKSIVFLSFPSDIKPGDHPYYQPVYLRLMPAAGGPDRVIAYVYGGQGTINVPSWSPDSRKLAFVSNSGM